MLTTVQFEALKQGRQNGFHDDSLGLVKLCLTRKRDVYDEIRNRAIPTGDYCLTGWGHVVASRYQPSIERLPKGTYINHRIHAYRRDTVVLADDSNNKSTVDVRKALCVRPNHHEGLWLIPLMGGKFTSGSPDEAWYLRNLLGMAVQLDLKSGGTVDDFLSS